MTYNTGDRVIALRQNDVAAVVVATDRPGPLLYTIEYCDGGHLQQRHVSEDNLRLVERAPQTAEPALPAVGSFHGEE